MSNPSDWDDHRTVVALEYIVKRLVVDQCKRSADPKAELANWLHWLKAQSEVTRRFAFEGGRNDDVMLNAIGLASEFTKFHDEIQEDFNES